MQTNKGPARVLQPLLKRAMFSGARPTFAGIPAGLRHDLMVLDYGNPRALELLRRKGKSLAAVLVEPVQSSRPELQPREFLQELRRVTEASGTALIFDEMISGFRVAQGGAQEYFGVRADLATYGKIAGGGLPLSLIAGSARFMDRVDGGQWHFGDTSVPEVPTTMFAGTHVRHPLSLTAALAAAKMLLAAGPQLQRGLNATTADMVARLNDRMTAGGLVLHFTCFGSYFAVDNSRSGIDLSARALLSLIAFTGGLHMRPGDVGGFLSTAHGPDEVDAIVTTLGDALEELGAAGLIRSA